MFLITLSKTPIWCDYFDILESRENTEHERSNVQPLIQKSTDTLFLVLWNGRHRGNSSENGTYPNYLTN